MRLAGPRNGTSCAPFPPLRQPWKARWLPLALRDQGWGQEVAFATERSSGAREGGPACHFRRTLSAWHVLRAARPSPADRLASGPGSALRRARVTGARRSLLARSGNVRFQYWACLHRAASTPASKHPAEEGPPWGLAPHRSASGRGLSDTRLPTRTASLGGPRAAWACPGPGMQMKAGGLSPLREQVQGTGRSRAPSISPTAPPRAGSATT